MTKTCSRCKREYARDSYLDHAWHEEKIKYCLGERI